MLKFAVLARVLEGMFVDPVEAASDEDAFPHVDSIKLYNRRIPIDAAIKRELPISRPLVREIAFPGGIGVIGKR